MCNQLILLPSLAISVVAAILVSCATTMVDISPSPQSPVCDSAASAFVFWAPQWRPNQKDVSKREAATETGLKEFLQTSGCFKNSELRRVPSLIPTIVASEIGSTNRLFNKVVVITLRELGPVVTLLLSLTLTDGGTDVVLQVDEYIPLVESRTRTFTVHWKNGGPGVIKGVASLPQELRAALITALQPNSPIRNAAP
jgi:hypothetical protein